MPDVLMIDLLSVLAIVWYIDDSDVATSLFFKSNICQLFETNYL